MPTEDDLLVADFQQCFEQMRHYDSQFILAIKFLYTLYVGIAGASYVLVTARQEEYGTIMAAGLLCFGAIVGVLFLYYLLRTRVYYTRVARYINEIRLSYLRLSPMAVENKAGIYTDPAKPRAFSPASTHIILMCFTSLCNASMFAGSSALLEQIPGPHKFLVLGIFFIALLSQLSFLTWYLWRRDEPDASLDANLGSGFEEEI